LSGSIDEARLGYPISQCAVDRFEYKQVRSSDSVGEATFELLKNGFSGGFSAGLLLGT